MTIEEAKSLTDVELRIKVAELLGWKKVEVHTWVNDVRVPKEWTVDSLPPDCPNDLNAIHEAWMDAETSDEQEKAFPENIARAYLGRRPACCSDYIIALVNATSRQRAEAFVLTMEGGAA